MKKRLITEEIQCPGLLSINKTNTDQTDTGKKRICLPDTSTSQSILEKSSGQKIKGESGAETEADTTENTAS